MGKGKTLNRKTDPELDLTNLGGMAPAGDTVVGESKSVNSNSRTLVDKSGNVIGITKTHRENESGESAEKMVETSILTEEKL